MPDNTLPPPPTDIELLHSFLAQKIRDGEVDTPIAEVMDKFPIYKQEMFNLRDKVQVALDQSARGETSELDFDKIRARLERRIQDSQQKQHATQAK